MKGLRPVVSIIIPTYKDWYRLALCLDRLNQQSWPKENFEVIVINNDPGEVAPDFLKDYLTGNVTLLDEVKSGSYAARNTGIRHATGDIFGFTDSDCLPDKDWIAAAVDLFEKESCDRIGGNIEIFYEKEGRPTNAEIYEKVFAFKQAETVQASGVCVTGNMFSKRYVFDTVGLFNEDLFSGGDYEWGKRAADQGFTIAYGEDVKIFHPARRNMDELLKKAKRVGGGTAHHLHGSKKRAIVDYVKTFEPSMYIFHMLRNYGRELSLYQKIKVFLLRRYIKHTMNLEKLKVVFGKTANRQ